ncbi:MAG: putative C2 calcium dependent membrane targeting [Streblomastix strix]|uniref:Putative C2 calcium dependent membrane targeting n=1 Tax=Streblomastix strix TaxID=222440 RepID=A0A5J4V6T1_9EUKA|nr:MAG: putative C2 calcium dependent membrane targeting [Streblomastix strix]
MDISTIIKEGKEKETKEKAETVTYEVTVIEASKLPVMDVPSNSTDAYVEIHYGLQNMQKTKIKKKSLNPEWNEEFKLKISKDFISDDNIIEFRVMDKDTLTSDDLIGSVFLDLFELCSSGKNETVGDWFPIMDSLIGINGYLHVSVRYENTTNSTEDKSAVIFSSLMQPPACWEIKSIVGLVRGLLTEKDPEHQWVDRVRASKLSNIERTKTFAVLKSKLRKRIIAEAQAYSCNAVLGFTVMFDMEGEVGLIVGRAIGTAAIIKKYDIPSAQLILGSEERNKSDPNTLKILPEIQQDNFRMPFIPPPPAVVFCTLNSLSIPYTYGSAICVRAVHVLKKKDEHARTSSGRRIAWWGEVQAEAARQAMQCGCNVVIGYKEKTAVFEHVCVLTGEGTAIRCNPWITKIIQEEKKQERNSERELNQSTPINIQSPYHSPSTLIRDQSPVSSPGLEIQASQQVQQHQSTQQQQSHQDHKRERTNKCACCSNACISEFVISTTEPPSFLINPRNIRSKY